MNKTILIAGGTALVSLAVGTAGGYFFAKKRFEDDLPEIIDNETNAIKKHYSVMLMEAKSGKPDSPADIPRREDDVEEADEELSEADEKTIANAKKAITDYQGISTKIVREKEGDPSKTVIEKNIFTSGEAKDIRPLPPRGPGGKFVRQSTGLPQRGPEQTPYIITMETYLLGEEDYEQKTLRYFKQDDTLIDVEDNDEPYDIARVGEVNLTLFPEPDGTGRSILCVRNEGLGTDYEIQLMTESLTEYKGLSGNADDDVDESAWL